MDFEYSDEQRLFSETLRKFLNTGYGFDARAKIISSSAGFSEDVWAAMAEMGILGVPFDAEHGGFGGQHGGHDGRDGGAGRGARGRSRTSPPSASAAGSSCVAGPPPSRSRSCRR